MCSACGTHTLSRYILVRSAAVAASVLVALVCTGCTGCSGCSPVATPSPSASVATGVTSTVVPDVVGKRADEARAQITSSGFRIDWSPEVTPPAVLPPADWEVVSQQPMGGQTGPPNSVVHVVVAAPATGSPNPSASDLTTRLGLTFEVAAAVCAAQGRNTSPSGWNATFDPAEASEEGDSLVLHATLTPQPGVRGEPQAVECTVGGSDISPALQLFWVR